MTLEHAVRQFLDHQLALDRSPHTVSCYRRDLKWLAEHVGADQDVNSITPGMIDSFLLSPVVSCLKDGRPKAAISVGRTRSTVKSFGRWLLEAGLVKNNPAILIRVGRQNRKPPTYLTDDEVRLLLKTIRSHKGWLAARDLVIIQLFLQTGIRLAELVALDVDDINIIEKRMTVHVKGGRTVNKFLNSTVRTILHRYIRGCPKVLGSNRALFLSQVGERISKRHVQRRLDQWVAKAGIGKHVSPHALRHTFATSLYSRTSNILAVQQALGHSSVTTTQVYTHLLDDSLEDALEML